MRLGIIDVGTNSLKLSVYDYDLDKEIFCKRVVTRLGQNCFENKILIKEAMDRTLKILEDFVKISCEYGVKRVEIFATSCVRDAKNKQEFLDLVKKDLGIDINVISGDREAEIIFSAVVNDFLFGNEKRLINSSMNKTTSHLFSNEQEKIKSPLFSNEQEKIKSPLLSKGGFRGVTDLPLNSVNNIKILLVDIGGGSTELILGNEKGIVFEKSLDIGIVRMYDKFFNCPTDKKGYMKTLEYTKNLIEPIAENLEDYTYFIGSSGTFTNIFDWIKSRNLCENTCDSNVFVKEIHNLLAMTLEERKIQKGINPDRADIIGAGGAIVEALCNKLDIKEIFVTQTALKEGLVYLYK